MSPVIDGGVVTTSTSQTQSSLYVAPGQIHVQQLAPSGDYSPVQITATAPSIQEIKTRSTTVSFRRANGSIGNLVMSGGGLPVVGRQRITVVDLRGVTRGGFCQGLVVEHSSRNFCFMESISDMDKRLKLGRFGVADLQDLAWALLAGLVIFSTILGLWPSVAFEKPGVFSLWPFMAAALLGFAIVRITVKLRRRRRLRLWLRGVALRAVASR